MALFNESDLRARAERSTTFQKSASIVLNEKVLASSTTTQFDIFLSHSFNDQKLILGIWLSLEDMGYKVYVDWIHDRSLSRESVTKETASLLRKRLISCRSLFFATSLNSSQSKWMPWELGFKDGHNNRAAIFPVSQSQNSTDTYLGQEYLGIYPYVTYGFVSGREVKKLWVHNTGTNYVIFDKWLDGEEPSQH